MTETAKPPKPTALPSSPLRAGCESASVGCRRGPKGVNPRTGPQADEKSIARGGRRRRLRSTSYPQGTKPALRSKTRVSGAVRTFGFVIDGGHFEQPAIRSYPPSNKAATM